MTFLVDTNVISELQKPAPDATVASWYDSVDDEDLYLSVATVGEIAQGIEAVRRKSPERAGAYDAWLSRLRHGYRRRLIDVDADIGELWGRLNGQALAQGEKPQVMDNLIAASAISRGLVLATRNTKDFRRAKLTLFNPWQQEVE